MSFIEGVGDEVVVFAVIVLVLILAATITFLLNSSPFTEHQQISSSSSEPVSNQNHEQQQNVDEGVNQENRNSDTVTSNHTTVSDANENDEIMHETEVIQASDDTEVTSENVDSHLYPDINESITPTAPEPEAEPEPELEPESSTDNEEVHSSDPEAIRVRLKYLDDTERTVMSHPKVKIGDFKRTHFVEDIANNKVVRLIFSGQLLQDNATLEFYHVANNCVIHVQILQAQTQQSPSSISQNTDLDLSHLLWPLLSVILGICWILYLKYPEFFNFMSLGMLLLFTGSFFYFYFQIQHQ